MKRMLAMLVLIVLPAPALAAVPRWGVFEAALDSPTPHANPYTEVNLEATFEGPQGREIVIEGFWDGGTTWRVRMAPTAVGRWRYRTRSNDPALDGRTGEFTCAPSESRGFVRVNPEHPHSFAYDDGTPIYWLTCNGVVDRDFSMADGSFQRFIDTRARQGFVHLNGDGSLLAKPKWNERSQRNEGGPPCFDYDIDRLNPAYFQAADRRVRYALSRGIIPEFGLGWPDQGIFDRFSHEQLERLWRYAVARYAAFNVTWDLFGEFEEAGDQAVAYANRYGELTRRCDPYHHLLTTHSVDSNDELAGEPWLDIVMQQSTNWNLVTADWTFDKPIVNAEYCYENNTGQPMTQWYHVVMDSDLVRTGAWEIASRGGYFVYEISGIERNWPRSLDTQAARWVLNLAGFFKRLPYWRLEPAPDRASRGTCLAADDGTAVVYLPVGGEVSVRAEGSRGGWWFDPREGTYSPAARTEESGLMKFRAPDTRDWTLLLGSAPPKRLIKAAPTPGPPVTPAAGRAAGGLLALYRFDSGDGQAEDASGAGVAPALRAVGGDAIRWLPGGGAEIGAGGRLVSDGPAESLARRLAGAGGLSVEAWFQSASLTQDGPARIVTLSGGPSRRDFTLGQTGGRLSVRLRTSIGHPNGVPDLVSPDPVLAQAAGPLHVVFTFDGAVKRLYLDGRIYATVPTTPCDLGNWEAFPLAVGDEPGGERQWLGQVYLVAIYDRALTAEEAAGNFAAERAARGAAGLGAGEGQVSR